MSRPVRLYFEALDILKERGTVVKKQFCSFDDDEGQILVETGHTKTVLVFTPHRGCYLSCQSKKIHKDFDMHTMRDIIIQYFRELEDVY